MTPFTLALSDDQKTVRDWVHTFAAQTLRPAAAEWDEREETPWPIIQEAAKIGLYSLDFFTTQAFDPTGLGIPLIMEELFWGDAGIALALCGTTLAAAALVANGTPEQTTTWAPHLFGTPDDIHVAAFCSSEPDAGSDVSAMRTRATHDPTTGDWTLNGVKTWATNGGIAHIHIVVATVDPTLGSRGQAAFLIPPNTPGLAQGQKFKKHGIRASHTAEVVLDNVRVPAHCLLGDKDHLDQRLAHAKNGTPARSNAAMATFESSRPAVAAQAVGIARAAYETALDYARTRHQFGRPIIDNQGIAFTIADMRTRIDAARLLTWRASWMAATGQPFTAAEGSMSKLHAGETAKWVTTAAMQILGGNGYTREYPVERMHRDSAIYTIFEGTSEIQRLVIARTLAGIPIR